MPCSPNHEMQPSTWPPTHPSATAHLPTCSASSIRSIWTHSGPHRGPSQRRLWSKPHSSASGGEAAAAAAAAAPLARLPPPGLSSSLPLAGGAYLPSGCCGA